MFLTVFHVIYISLLLRFRHACPLAGRTEPIRRSNVNYPRKIRTQRPEVTVEYLFWLASLIPAIAHVKVIVAVFDAGGMPNTTQGASVGMSLGAIGLGAGACSHYYCTRAHCDGFSEVSRGGWIVLDK